ncbi:MAG: hypothetical protein JST80_01045 [Bdellovibrionales bacterium]|nr:hypothetical protein [Bdellovibrionales bacterium]
MIVQKLRKIQIDWALTNDELAKVSHTPLQVLSKYMGLKPEAIDELPSVPPGLENVVALVSIHASLQKLRPEAETQQEWLQQPNSVLENQIPIQVMMMSPDHLFWVSYTLDSAVR